MEAGKGKSGDLAVTKDWRVHWIFSSSPSVLLFFPITRTSLPRRPAYLIAIPRSRYSPRWFALQRFPAVQNMR
jgi:hypothetical protein